VATGVTCGVLSWLWLAAPAWGLDADQPLYRGRPTSDWVADLKDPRTHRDAIKALAALGPEKEAVPALLAALPDTEPDLDATIIEILFRIGAIEPLCSGLNNPDARVRKVLAQALGKLGPKAGDAVDALIRALPDADAEVRPHVVGALRQIGAAADQKLLAVLSDSSSAATARVGAAQALGNSSVRSPEKTQALRHVLESDPEGEVRLAAAVSLAALQPGATIPLEAVRMLRDGLGAKQDAVRRQASKTALGSLTPPSAAIPDLLGALDDPDPTIRAVVMIALSKAGADANAAAPLLRNGLKPEHAPRVREGAARALRLLGPRAEGAAPALREQAQRGDFAVAFAAAIALAAIRPGADETKVATEPILRGLSDRDYTVRSEAVAALGRIVPDPQALPGLLQALNTTDYTVTNAVTQALRTLGKNAVDPLREEFKKKTNDKRTRIGAARALGGLGPQAREASQALAGVAGADGEDPAVRFAAAVALGKIAPEMELTSTLLEPVRTALEDSNYGIRHDAVEVLGRISPRKAVVPALVEALTSTDQLVQNLAQAMLGKTGAEAVDPLLGVLRSNKASPKGRVAVQALGRVGPQAEAALGDLIALLGDADPKLNLLYLPAITALSQIGPKAVPQLREAVKRSADRPNQAWVQEGAARALGRIGPPRPGGGHGAPGRGGEKRVRFGPPRRDGGLGGH
jgi:HEAT repeat protein